ncbi:MAG: transcription antitermination factor NusB [Coriobacteriia bacterium]|nr:transcription antitermination factor NusB [Coriobacteriia bacterium]
MSCASAARKEALNILSYARAHKSYVRNLIYTSPSLKHLSFEDQAFVTKLVLGVTSSLGILDEAIDKYVDKPNKLAPALRDVLRIATFELFFLHKEPYVVVDQGVELAKITAKHGSGLANAVLRKIAEDAQSFPYGDPQESFEALARSTGFPLELARLIEDSLGTTRTRSLMSSQLKPAPLFVVTIPFKTADTKVQDIFDAHNIVATPILGIAGGWSIHTPHEFLRSGLIDSHGFLPMDFSAQMIAKLVATNEMGSILEIGSGRGTKTADIVSQAARKGERVDITAFELYPYKSKIAKERLEKLGIDFVKHVNGNATKASDLEGLGQFDTVFIDAPCSGTGTLRRHPELVWNLKLSAIKSLNTLQFKMLKNTAKHVAPGGALIYSTCSVLKMENEDMVQKFLNSKAGQDFELNDVVNRKGISKEFKEKLTEHSHNKMIRTFVQEGSADAHFCALLKRKA